MEANLWPIIRTFSERIQKWKDLPLTLYGRANLFKMIFLPKFLYVLSNAPIYIPKKIFKHINSLLTSFLWGNKAARVSLEVLQLPVQRGGLAVPDLRLYYLTSQLVFIRWRMFPQFNNAAVAVEAAAVTSYETLLNFFFRGEVPTEGGKEILKSAKRILGICIKHIIDNPLHLSPNAPLWFNPNLKEFFNLEDGFRWAKYGLTYLHQLGIPIYQIETCCLCSVWCWAGATGEL